MKKRFLSMLIAFAMIVCVIPGVFADGGTQVNFDPYTKTRFVDYASVVKGTITNSATLEEGAYLGGTGASTVICFKDMNFTDVAATKLTLRYARSNHAAYSDGIFYVRKGAADGPIIAKLVSGHEDDKKVSYTLENVPDATGVLPRTGNWELWGTTTVELNEGIAAGVFDLYFCYENDSCGNLVSFQFDNGVSDATEPVDAVSAIHSQTGFTTDGLDAEYGLTTGEGYAATTGDYGDLNAIYGLDFGDGYNTQLVLNAEVFTGGKMALFDACVGENNANLLQEIEIPETDGYEDITIDLDEAVYNLSGVRYLCMAFDNTIEISLKNFKFVQTFDPFLGDDEVNVVYIGGSITAGAGSSTNDKCWVSLVGEQLSEKYGDRKTFNNYNVGIGGTGSDLGLMRLKSDVIDKAPDMVFIEFSVNDQGSELALAQMESIVMTLQKMEKTPYIVFVFTTTKALSGTDYQKYHRMVADHYGIPYVDLDAHVIADGKVLDKDTEGTILGDNTHPNDAGYAYYAGIINEAMEKPSYFVRPEAKATKLSEKSQAVEIATIPVSAFTVSGTAGTDYEIKDGKVYLYTQNAKVTATYTGDMLGTTDYIWNMGGKYTVTVDGVTITDRADNGTWITARDTYYKNSATGVLNLGYLEMGLPNGTHTVELAMVEGGTPTAPQVQLGQLYYNKSADDGIPVKSTVRTAYSYDDAIKAAKEYYEGSKFSESNNNTGIVTVAGYLESTLKDQWISYKDVDLTQGVGKVWVDRAYKQAIPGTIQVRVGSPTGTVIAEIAPDSRGTGTGSWNAFEKTESGTVINNVYGIVDVYLTFANGICGNIDKIWFEPAPSLDVPAAQLNEYNYSEKSDGILTFNEAFDFIGNGDYITYNVNVTEDFADRALVVAEVSSYDKTGKITVRDGSADGEIVAEIDVEAYGDRTVVNSAKGALTQYGKSLTGSHTLYVVFEGEKGFASFNGLRFMSPKGLTDLLNTTNLDEIGGGAILPGSGMIESFNIYGAYAKWEDIDFGDEEKLLQVEVYYGVGATHTGCAVEIRLDDPDGEIIGRGRMTEAGGWSSKNTYFTANLYRGITGIHDVYVRVQDHPEMTLTRAGNIRSLQFKEVAEGTTYLTSNQNWQNFYQSIATVTPAEGAKNIMLITAVYDDAGKLLTLKADTKDIKEAGVTAFETITLKQDLASITTGYKVVTYLWNGETLAPINEQVLITEVEAPAGESTEVTE